jgi:hypothetical protein
VGVALEERGEGASPGCAEGTVAGGVPEEFAWGIVCASRTVVTTVNVGLQVSSKMMVSRWPLEAVACD